MLAPLRRPIAAEPTVSHWQRRTMHRVAITHEPAGVFHGVGSTEISVPCRRVFMFGRFQLGGFDSRVCGSEEDVELEVVTLLGHGVPVDAFELVPQISKVELSLGVELVGLV